MGFWKIAATFGAVIYGSLFTTFDRIMGMVLEIFSLTFWTILFGEGHLIPLLMLPLILYPLPIFAIFPSSGPSAGLSKAWNMSMTGHTRAAFDKITPNWIETCSVWTFSFKNKVTNQKIDFSPFCRQRVSKSANQGLCGWKKAGINRSRSYVSYRSSVRYLILCSTPKPAVANPTRKGNLSPL